MTNFQIPMVVRARRALARPVSRSVPPVGHWPLGVGHYPRLFANGFPNNPGLRSDHWLHTEGSGDNPVLENIVTRKESTA